MPDAACDVSAQCLRAHATQLVERFVTVARHEVPAARSLSDVLLIDSLPELLQALATRLTEPHAADSVVTITRISEAHAEQRAALPAYTVGDVLREYQLLRRLIFNVLRPTGCFGDAQQDVIQDAIDNGVTWALRRFCAISDAREARARHDAAEAHAQIERQLAELNTIIDCLPEAVSLGTFDGITRANQRALAMFGFETLAELNGDLASLARVMQSCDPDTGDLIPFTSLPFVQALHGVSAVADTAVRHARTGARRIIRASSAPVRVGGVIVGAVSVNVDVTEERQREQALARALAGEQEARREVQATVALLENERALREQFVSALTHDLRTPLTAAKMSAEVGVRTLALDATTESIEKARRLLRRIVDGIGRTETLIQDLLDTNRIKAGEPLAMDFEDVNLTDLVQECLDDLAAMHGKRFVLESSSPGPVHGKCSPTGVRRMLENLCGNAVKYGQPDTPITVRLNERHGVVAIHVHNVGPAIPPEDHQALFEPFRRLAPAQESGQKGWGIGLTLVRGIAEAHGGRADVESAVDEGTTFSILLPDQPGASVLQ